VPANDPVKRDAKPNVSESNAVPTSSEGSFDKVLQESVQDAEKLRTMQAPNYKGVWSRSQTPREVAMSGPRFEQSIMEDQVRLVVHSRKREVATHVGTWQRTRDNTGAFG
jgi:NADH dehydrogenase (ubiquinone) Fe-S protein 6